MAALVWRQLISLIRAPRFRLLFIMGFSFGLLIWLPLALQSGGRSPIRTNYLTVVTAYSIMLLGDVLFWNVFGPDRAAAQIWFVLPIGPQAVLVARNIAAATFVLLESLLVAAACLVFRMPVTVTEVAEALGVAGVLTSFMVSVGNLLSVWHPRPADPSRSWRTSTGSTQAWLLLLYPVVGSPVLLAYGARYAFDTSMAFWVVLGIDLMLAGCVYSVTLDYAAKLLVQRRELVVNALAHSDSPVAG
jgi:ABC-2 type transport system permease protein